MGKTKVFLTCRTCLKKTDPTKCRLLTPETLYDGKLLLKMLNFSIPEMLMDLASEYPAMCRQCMQRLNHVYKFKMMCLKNDVKYSKKNLMKTRDSSENVPSIDCDTTNKAINFAPENHIDTDDNQNETCAINRAMDNQIEQTTLSNKTLKKKHFSPYKKRFTNNNCFGCQNHIPDVKYHNGEVLKKYICFNCGKCFIAMAEIRKHMHSHISLHKCEICDKRWRDAYQLSQHLLTHTKQKPYQCPECDKKFVQRHNLHQHLATHKGAKDNKNRCEECGKILSTKYNLKIHLTSHNIGYKPRCPVCNKWFYTEAARIKHSKICVVVKEESEIFIGEPEFLKTEVLDDVKCEWPQYVKCEHIKTEVSENITEENQSDDDLFVEETPFQSALTQDAS